MYKVYVYNDDVMPWSDFRNLVANLNPKLAATCDKKF